jgi:large subunit ribosomal protein L15e
VSIYKHIKETMQSEYKERSPEYKSRIIKWNTESSITRVDRPTNLARARELGYRAKEGIIVARVRVHGGTRKRKHNAGGRKPHASGRYFTQEKSLQSMAEERASRRFPNFEALNSYFVGSAGSRRFFEVIMLDRNSNSIRSDPHYSSVVRQKGRAFRGLTSSGIRHRGMSKKRFGSHDFRPSKNRFKASNPGV